MLLNDRIHMELNRHVLKSNLNPPEDPVFADLQWFNFSMKCKCNHGHHDITGCGITQHTVALTPPNNMWCGDECGQRWDRLKIFNHKRTVKYCWLLNCTLKQCFIAITAV